MLDVLTSGRALWTESFLNNIGRSLLLSLLLVKSHQNINEFSIVYTDAGPFLEKVYLGSAFGGSYCHRTLCLAVTHRSKDKLRPLRIGFLNDGQQGAQVTRYRTKSMA